MSEIILPKGYLSASAMGTMLRCPKQFEFRYIHDVISPPSAALVLGKATHSTFEDYYGDVINKSERLSPSIVSDLSVYMLDNELESSDLTLKGKDYDEAVDDLRGMTGAYVEHIGQFIDPISTEEKFTYVTKDGIELLGYLDLKHRMCINETSGEHVIGLADYKVTGKKWNAAKLVNSLQFNIYNLCTGIKHIQIHNLVKGGKVKVLPKKGASEDGVVDITNKHRILHIEFDDSEHSHFEGLVYQLARLITAGIFCPCDPESWCCNADWCGYWSMCRGAKKADTRFFDVAPTPSTDQISPA